MILPIPIYQITTTADVKPIECISWWLFDRIPQGFAGRIYAKQSLANHPELHLNLTDWSDEVILQVLAGHPANSIGNLLLGEQDLTRYESPLLH